MKKFASSAKRITALLIALLTAFSFVACKKGNDNPVSGKPSISVSFADTIKNGDKLPVVVAVSDDSAYRIVSGKPSIVEVISETSDGNVSFYLQVADTARVEVDTKVDITVELINDTSVSKTKSITVLKNSAASAPVMTAAAKNLNSDSAKTVLRAGDDNAIRLEVSISNLPYDDTSFTVSFEEPAGYEGLVKYDAAKGLIVVAKENMDLPKEGVPVTVKVTSNALSSLSEKIEITVKNKLKEGSVGDLTQEMLSSIANEKITVNAEIKDVVKYNSAADGTSSETYYDTVVKMDGNSWYGEYKAKGSDNATVNANTYAKGKADGNGNYYVNELYINKNNKSAAKQLKDTDSNPLVWYDSDDDAHDGRHFWNHLSGLFLGKFAEEENDVYAYDIEPGAIEYDWVFQTYEYTPSDDEWLMAYVAWSFTPILSSGDQFDEFRIFLTSDGKGGKKIEKIVATTAAVELYTYDEEGSTDVVGSEYTVCTFTFANIGSTVVGTPAPYSETVSAGVKVYFDALTTALSNMSGKVENYTFRMVESQEYAPSLDPNDYDMSGTTTASYTATSTSSSGKASGTNEISIRNYLSTSGDVGVRGYVTKEGALINETGQYSYAMDDYTYFTDVYGYKQNSNDTYETFEYDSENEALTGTRRKPGQFADLLPDFDVSPYVFTFQKMEAIENTTDKYLYTFVLKDSAITQEVAYALTLADYASDAVSSLKNSLLISVDSDGVLRTVGYAYDIAGMYGGYYTTTYSDVNKTALPEGIWDNYVARVVPSTWSDFKKIKYYADFSTIGNLEYISGDVAVERIFGSDIAQNQNFKKIPAALSNAFRDGLNGPWHDYVENGTESSGATSYLESLSFTVSYDLYDENYKITQYYDDIIALLTSEMSKCGFTLDTANTGKRGSSIYTCYVSEELGLRLRVESNMTRTFWLDLESTAYNWSLIG